MNYLWAALAFVMVFFLRRSFAELLQSHHWYARNYAGRETTFPWGILLVGVVAVLYALRLLAEGLNPLFIKGLIALYGAGFLGLVDDAVGDEKYRGVKGHLSAFFAERKLTSGLIKAVGGAILALALGLPADGRVGLLVAALNLALAMNAINLLDLRPGRACKAFFLAFFLLLLAGTRNAAVLLGLPLAMAVLAYFPLDLMEQGMLGDTGANALGAILGLMLAYDLTFSGQLLSLAFLTALHLIAARYSLSACIVSLPPLAALDRLGRPRK
ncbi:MAG: hypothetical protein PWQ41_446 [Bacillota bacterium]|jgi:hypothetical protein|nr:hypothetical protein [Bacillota bacterium]MDK2855748.1 hypothetical protein [Bacillota bacterium]MDK2924672.1 hypothetical protein [Bacillota bacterium]